MNRLLALLAVLALSGCAPVAATGSASIPAAPPDRLVFMAGYKAQANLPFVAAYVARERGLFREQNLEVEIQHSGGQGEHFRLAMSGQVEVTTATGADVLKFAADPGLPVVALALFGQRSDQAIAVRADSAIRVPKDLEGKTVGYKSFPSPEYLAILKANSVDRSKINEISVGFDPRILTEGRVDALPVFRSNEPDILRKLGTDVRLFSPDDYGMATLGLAYVASRDTVDRKRPLMVRFLRATLAATQWIAANPEEAVDIVMRYAPGEDRAHQLSMLKTEIDSAQSPAVAKDGPGAMPLEYWREAMNVYVQMGAIARPVDLERFVNDSLRKEALAER